MFEIELFYIWMNQNKYVFKPMNTFLNKWLYLLSMLNWIVWN